MPVPVEHDGADRLRPGGLALLASVVTLLGGAGVLPRWPGLVHLVALPPLDLVTDLGALLVHAPGYPSFAAGVALSLTVRAAVLAVMLGGLTRRRFTFALRFYGAVLPFAFVAAGLLYASPALLFYALFWFGLVVALALTAATAAAPWAAPLRLGPALAAAARRGFRLGTVGAYLAALAVVGAAADVTGPAGTVLLVPVSAALTFAAAASLRRDPGYRLLRRLVAAVPAGGVAALAAVVLLGPAGPRPADAPADPRAGSVLLMSGIDSRSGSGAILEIDPHAFGFTCQQTFYFSYAGPGDGQPRRQALCPVTHGAPYERRDTLRSGEELVPFLAAQTAALTPPGTVVGHSQGVWLVWEAAARRLLPDVRDLVLVGAFPGNPVAYPAEGEPGAGRVGRHLLGLVAVVPRPWGTTVFEPDSPLGREWLAHPDAIGQTLARPLPQGMRALSVPSVFDVPLMPEGPHLPGAVDACPVAVIHPNLPYAEEFRSLVVRFLEGRPPPGCPAWRTTVGPLARPFAVPPSGT